jgi:hypothetical protein
MLTSICIIAKYSLSVRHPLFLRSGASWKEKTSLGEITPYKLLILLLHALVRIQANLFSHYFLRKEGSGILATMEFSEKGET